MISRISRRPSDIPGGSMVATGEPCQPHLGVLWAGASSAAETGVLSILGVALTVGSRGIILSTAVMSMIAPCSPSAELDTISTRFPRAVMHRMVQMRPLGASHLVPASHSLLVMCCRPFGSARRCRVAPSGLPLDASSVSALCVIGPAVDGSAGRGFELRRRVLSTTRDCAHLSSVDVRHLTDCVHGRSGVDG